MSRDWKLYLDDMVAACEKVLGFTAGLDRQGFFGDEKTHDAVVRNIQILGEAAKHIPPRYVKACPRSNGRKSPE